MTNLFSPSLALAAVAAAGCGGRASTECSADPAPAESAVLVDISLDAVAGAQPFAMGAKLTSPAGLTYSVSMLRFYVSQLDLVDAQGVATRAVLADDAGAPLEYGVALVDYEKPDSTRLHVLAPPGSYTAMSLSIGVPEHCDDGIGVLNHENASEQAAPLDVDSDMYWGWDPGYVFFKIEGRTSMPGGGSTSFVFHVGDDKRFVTTTIPATLDVPSATAHHLAVDINQLFVTPSGELSPDPTGATTSNKVHGGREADVLAKNLSSSEVFQWRE